MAVQPDCTVIATVHFPGFVPMLPPYSIRIQSNLRVHSKSHHGELIPNNLTGYDDGLAYR